MNTQSVEFIRELRSVLTYHQAVGIEEYPHNEGVQKFLQVPVPLPVISSVKTEREAPLPKKVSVPRSVAVSTETLDDIRCEITDCRACELHAHRANSVAGRGAASARLLIVGEWLKAPEQIENTSEIIFGVEEDRMLANMLKAIHLTSTDVFVTNILKCSLPSSCQPVNTAVSVQCCLAYLRRQIAVIAPQLICTMGILPTRALLGPSSASHSLSHLRGRFHNYTTLDGRQIPLMPTYHPSYLLQITKMKEATWKDLQLIEKKLSG